MTFTEDENRIIEAMARAMCVADGFDPDSSGEVPAVIISPGGNRITGVNSWGKRWNAYECSSRRQYAAHKAMMMGLNKTPVQWTE